jgi:hypothetical protein
MYSPDDMFNPLHGTPRWRRGIPYFDLHVTTKSFNVDQHHAAGARRVLLLDKAYDPNEHRPLDLSEAERRRYGADVGVVGRYEPQRSELLCDLAEAGLDVVAWGGTWDRHPRRHPRFRFHTAVLRGPEYAKAINAIRINLGLLSKAGGDLHTARSIEIPACGAFMLAERTGEHQRLFEEGVEAEFFDSFDECLAKCRHYLAHEDERRRVAAAGYERCLKSGYDVRSRMATVLEELERVEPGR